MIPVHLFSFSGPSKYANKRVTNDVKHVGRDELRNVMG